MYVVCLLTSCWIYLVLSLMCILGRKILEVEGGRGWHATSYPVTSLVSVLLKLVVIILEL
jgi:hypothetical protein